MKIKICFITFFIIISLAVFSYAALDLKFASAIGITPASPKVGDTITFSVSFKAEGAAASNVKIIGKVDGIQVHERVFGSIPANATRTDSFTWTATAGSHNVSFTLDPAHTTGDSNYDNNTISKTFQTSSAVDISAAAGKLHQLRPNLIIKDLLVTPYHKEGCKWWWRISYKVKNTGDVKTPKEFICYVLFFCNGHATGPSWVTSPITLEPGQEHEYLKTGFVFDCHEIKFLVIIDMDNSVKETNEEDNHHEEIRYCSE